MNRIQKLNNWGAQDILDDEPLRSNEKLEIVWPDGEKEKVSIVVQGYSTSGYSQTYNSTAYVEGRVHGIPVLVPIAGLLARRIDGGEDDY